MLALLLILLWERIKKLSTSLFKEYKQKIKKIQTSRFICTEVDLNSESDSESDDELMANLKSDSDNDSE